MRLSCTVMEIWRLKDNGVMPLTFCGHVTLSVTWPFDSRGSTSCSWSMVTMRPSGTVTEIWRLKVNEVTSLTFGGHVPSSITWPFDSHGPRPGAEFLCVVHSDHASILHRYGEMAPQILDARAWTQKASIFGVDFGADLWSVCHRHYSSRWPRRKVCRRSCIYM